MTIGQFQMFQDFLYPSKLVSTFGEINELNYSDPILCECICGNKFRKNKSDLLHIEEFNSKKNSKRKNLCDTCSSKINPRFKTFLKHYKMVKEKYIESPTLENISFFDFIRMDNDKNIEYLCKNCGETHTIIFDDFIEKLKLKSPFCKECNVKIKGLKIAKSKLKFTAGYNFEIKRHENVCTVCFQTIPAKRKNVKENFICNDCKRKERDLKLKEQQYLKKYFYKPVQYYFISKLNEFKRFKELIKGSNVLKIFPKNSKLTPYKKPIFSAFIRCECGNKFFINSRQAQKSEIKCSICKSNYKRDYLTFDEVKSIEPNLLSPIKEFYSIFESINIQCDCGNIEERRIGARLGRKCKKCKRLKSHGEAKVENFLRRSDIKFVAEKTFPGLIGKRGYPLRYDFYLTEFNMLIEFDGAQHFEKDITFNNGYFSDFETIKHHDNLKNNWANENNISLIRIPWFKINEIDSIINIAIKETIGENL